MEARGYKDLADRLEELKAADQGDNGEARVHAGENLLEGELWEEAVNAVPDEYIDEGWLVGSVDRIASRVAPWLECGLTGLVVRYGPQLSHERMVENLDVFTAIAVAAGKSPRRS